MSGELAPGYAQGFGCSGKRNDPLVDVMFALLDIPRGHLIKAFRVA